MVDAGLTAIDAARKVNSGRNRIVHDLWLEDTSSANRDGDFWQAVRLAS